MIKVLATDLTPQAPPLATLAIGWLEDLPQMLIL